MCCAPLLIREMFIKDESRKRIGDRSPRWGGGGKGLRWANGNHRLVTAIRDKAFAGSRIGNGRSAQTVKRVVQPSDFSMVRNGLESRPGYRLGCQRISIVFLISSRCIAKKKKNNWRMWNVLNIWVAC
jgi:hypothetical protein